MRILSPSDLTSAKSRIHRCVSQIDEGELRRYVQSITDLGPRSEDRPEALEKTIAYLGSVLGGHGYVVREEQYGSVHHRNLLVERVGRSHPREVFEIAAHYDTQPETEGADDNASGVAGVLEIARVLADLDCARTIRLCFFGSEETDRAGSLYHVNHSLSRAAEKLKAVLVFEMIGYRSYQENSQRTPFRFPLILWPPRTGDFIAAVADFRSGIVATEFKNAAADFAPALRVFTVKRIGRLLKDGIRSDHSSYWRAHRKAIMITDTANFRNPHYHCASDKLETLDFSFIAEVCRAATAMALKWARCRLGAG
jgi:aminopeptidase YwaD